MNQIFDPLRQTFVESTPEEIVRQKWLEVMLNHLSFPKELIMVEKSLHAMPHLISKENLPNRRIDLCAFAKQDKEIKPLLLMECKCVPLNEKALYQVRGYNNFVGASYIAIANEKHILLGFEQEDEFMTLDFLPAYPLLIKAIS